MSVFSVKSAQWSKKHVITLNVVIMKILQCYKRMNTILKIQRNVGQSGLYEGQKGCICHSCKKALKNILHKKLSPPKNLLSSTKNRCLRSELSFSLFEKWVALKKFVLD